MRNRFFFLSVSGLTLALAACGSDSSEVDDNAGGAQDAAESSAPADVAGEDETDALVAGEGETDLEGDGAVSEEADADEPEAAPSAEPSAAPTPTPTPTQIAKMDPPASFATCNICHSTAAGQHGVGPSLAGVGGRKAGGASGYGNYSPAMQGSNITWNEANLQRFLVDPNAVVSGSTMPPPGLNASQAAEVAAYLKTL